MSTGNGFMMRTISVLHVEDNPAHALLVQRYLEGAPVHIQLAHNGEVALDYLFRRGAYADPDISPRPDVILLDLRMPRINGLELLKELRESSEWREIPVIVLSSSKSKTDIEETQRYQVEHYLVKPDGFSRLPQLIVDVAGS